MIAQNIDIGFGDQLQMVMVFMQDIFRLSDMKICVRAQVDTVCLINGKLQESEQLDEIMKDYL